MTNIPEISVLMPNYNGQDYLESAIRSTLQQTFESIELIVLDDGSTDASKSIIRSIQSEDDRLKLVELEHGGIVKALNRGIELSRGRYIARMDSDDLMLPDRLEQQYQYLEKHPDVLLGTQACLIDPKSRQLGMHSPLESHHDILQSCLAGMGSAIMHPTLMTSREIMLSLSGYREPYRHVEDLDLYLRAAAKGYQLHNLISTCGLQYRLHAKSVSNQKNALQMELKYQLLREFESQHVFTPDWAGMKRAENMLPRTRADFFRRWAVIAYNFNHRALAHHYAFRSMITPPLSWSGIIESLKIVKASFASK